MATKKTDADKASKTKKTTTATRKTTAKKTTAKKTAATKSVARIKASPPIMGVPSLDLCQRGPMSSIFCPTLWDRRIGIKIRKKTTVRANTDRVTAKKAIACGSIAPIPSFQNSNLLQTFL